MNLTDWD
ncbi:hypothetical protein TOPH_09173 [Tolypocladium ophioglossoides CBS 100239]|nr:hypothetical protein TOPH_09173 [Tolypocladium ophioglossoides CBS 100239]